MSRIGPSCVLAALILIAGLRPAESKPLDDYLRLIAAFPDDPRYTLREFVSLPKAAIDQAVAECLTAEDIGRARGASGSSAAVEVTFRCSPRELFGAALLHAEAVDVLLADNPGLATFHIERGKKLLSMFLSKDLRRNPDVRLLQAGRIGAEAAVAGLDGQETLFVQRWYALVIRICLTYGQWNLAAALIRESLGVSPASVELLFAAALAVELPVLKGFPVLREGVETLKSAVSNVDEAVRKQLEQAAIGYRSVLRHDPRHEEARLRLLWIHMILADSRADEEAAALVGSELSPESRYLGSLLQGAVAEHDRKDADALLAFERAYQTAPQYQTGCVAFSHALRMSGDLARAREIADACLATGETAGDPDPWWQFRGGQIDTTTAKWLHQKAWP